MDTINSRIIIGIIVILFSIFFLSAFPGVEVFKDTGGIDVFNATEDTTFLFNITFNNTNDFADIANVTEINITLPPNFAIDLVGSNYTNAFGRFTNTSNTLSWYNR